MVRIFKILLLGVFKSMKNFKLMFKIIYLKSCKSLLIMNCLIIVNALLSIVSSKIFVWYHLVQISLIKKVRSSCIYVSLIYLPLLSFHVKITNSVLFVFVTFLRRIIFLLIFLQKRLASSFFCNASKARIVHLRSLTVFFPTINSWFSLNFILLTFF